MRITRRPSSRTPRSLPKQQEALSRPPPRRAATVRSMVPQADRFEVTQRPSLSVEGTLTDPAQGGRPDFAQGSSNACGTTCLAIALHRLGIEIPRTQIDREIRNFNLFTPPTALAGYARGQGLQADVYNHGSFEQLQADLAAGRQILVLTDVGGYDQNRDLTRGSSADLDTHWLVVTGVSVENGQRLVHYDNPWGTKETLPWDRFEALWRDVHALGLPTGYDHAYLLVDRADAPALRPSDARDIAGVNEFTGGISDVGNGFAELTRGDVTHGLLRLGRGLGDTLLGAARTAVATVKNLARRAVGGFFSRLFG